MAVIVANPNAMEPRMMSTAAIALFAVDWNRTLVAATMQMNPVATPMAKNTLRFRPAGVSSNSGVNLGRMVEHGTVGENLPVLPSVMVRGRRLKV